MAARHVEDDKAFLAQLLKDREKLVLLVSRHPGEAVADCAVKSVAARFGFAHDDGDPAAHGLDVNGIDPAGLIERDGEPEWPILPVALLKRNPAELMEDARFGKGFGSVRERLFHARKRGARHSTLPGDAADSLEHALQFGSHLDVGFDRRGLVGQV